MADSIKKFFKKKKKESHFKHAGPGHKLNEERQIPKQTPSRDVYVPPSRSGLTDESKQAAAAALARFEGKKPQADFSKSMAAIRAQVKKEMEEEKAAKVAEPPAPLQQAAESTSFSDLAVSGVYFRCPAIGEEVLPKEEWKQRIREYLKGQMETDPGLTAVLTLHSLNGNREKIQQCVDTLCKYFENIIQNSTEEKYRKIRKSNKIFQERVAPLEGAVEVLESAGFASEDEFFVFPDSLVNEEGLQNLEMIMDALKCAEPITLELDRNLTVLVPSQATARYQLPRDFFHVTPDDLKKAHQARVDAVEKSSMLMTKAMREREEMRELRNYRYCLLRVRFPDGIYLQGTFGAYEPFKAVTDFLRENLTESDGEFALIGPTGDKIPQDEEKTLMDLRLVPSSVLKFQGSDDLHLLPEVLVLIQGMNE